MLCWNIRFIIMLSLNFFFCLSSVRGRCFWASQILWWILTSSEQKFCFDCKPLLESYVDGIDNLDDLKCSVELSDLLSSCNWTFSSVYQAGMLKNIYLSRLRQKKKFNDNINKSNKQQSILNRLKQLFHRGKTPGEACSRNKTSVELSDLLSSHWTLGALLSIKRER